MAVVNWIMEPIANQVMPDFLSRPIQVRTIRPTAEELSSRIKPAVEGIAAKVFRQPRIWWITIDQLQSSGFLRPQVRPARIGWEEWRSISWSGMNKILDLNHHLLPNKTKPDLWTICFPGIPPNNQYCMVKIGTKRPKIADQRGGTVSLASASSSFSDVVKSFC